jgi:hypothetical protein
MTMSKELSRAERKALLADRSRKRRKQSEKDRKFEKRKASGWFLGI